MGEIPGSLPVPMERFGRTAFKTCMRVHFLGPAMIVFMVMAFSVVFPSRGWWRDRSPFQRLLTRV